MKQQLPRVLHTVDALEIPGIECTAQLLPMRIVQLANLSIAYEFHTHNDMMNQPCWSYLGIDSACPLNSMCDWPWVKYTSLRTSEDINTINQYLVLHFAKLRDFVNDLSVTQPSKRI